MKIAGVFLALLIFGGLLAYHAVFLIPVPASAGYNPPTDAATVAYRNTVRALAVSSMALLDFAAGLSVALAWVAALSKGNISDSARRGIILFATAFTTVWIFSSTYFVSFFLYSLLRYY